MAVEFNDLEAVARALRTGEIAAVLTEPALTNIGIVAPDDGFHAGLRALCDETGTLLMIDETHTLSAGPGRRHRGVGPRPDIVTMGKAIAGGIPIGAFGLRDDLAARILALVDDENADIEDVGGIGGTLAGNALSMAAARACLGEVLTDGGLHPDGGAGRTTGRPGRGHHRPPRRAVDHHPARGPGRVPVLLPRRRATEPSPTPPTIPSSTSTCTSTCRNRDVLITPFHNMVLMCPETTEADVDLHGRLFEEAVAALAG